MARKQRIPFGSIKKIKQSNENEVQNSICEYLEMKRHFFWRQNTIAVFDAKNKRFRTPPKYSMNGVSDIILLHGGMSYFLEVKDKGRQSDSQKVFEEKVKESGCQYHVVRSIDDVIKLGL